MPPFKKRLKRCTVNKELENIDNLQLCSSGDDDRLSSLPDNLLISILSLIPFSSAVATSVLSHRWRHLWTYLTHISFQFSNFYEGNFDGFLNSITTINHVISKVTSPKIHTFDLHIPFFIAQEQACSFLLGSSIHEICLRNPDVIKIGLNNRSYLCQLSTSLFKTQSLVWLILDSPFQFDFAVDAQIVIDLPNLKRLSMFLCDSNRRLMHTLFKSCPLVEHLCLYLQLEENDHHVDILAPNLKSLTVDGYGKDCVVLIDAPKLVTLETRELAASVFYHFVKNLRCLDYANIIIPEYHASDGDYYLSQILDLFHGISSARSLSFTEYCFHDLLLDAALPSFPNLVNLDFDWYVVDSNSWVPSCLLSNVKIMSVGEMKPNDNGIRVLQDILRNGTVLEQLHVHCDFDCDEDEPLKIRLCKEYEFVMKLFKLPKTSTSCRIKLYGEIIDASSEDFKHGRLTCELQDWISYVDQE